MPTLVYLSNVFTDCGNNCGLSTLFRLIPIKKLFIVSSEVFLCISPVSIPPGQDATLFCPLKLPSTESTVLNWSA